MSESTKKVRIYEPVRVGQRIKFSGVKPKDLLQEELSEVLESIAQELGVDNLEGQTFVVKGFIWTEEHDEIEFVTEECVVYQVVTLREKTEDREAFEVSSEYFDIPYLELDAEQARVFWNIARAAAEDRTCQDSIAKAIMLCMPRPKVSG
ncbi:MAG: hypothetical protein WC242_03770 [Candidatus Paceibacterota bacterium]|jgi:hypothetical protein